MRLPRPKAHHWVVAGLLAALGATSLLLPGPVRGETDLPVPTTYSTEPGGLQGLYMACEGLGLRVDRFTGRLEELDPATTPALAVIGSCQADVDPGPITAWVEAGGRLLLASRDERLLLPFGFKAAEVAGAPGAVLLEGRARAWEVPGTIPPSKAGIEVQEGDPWELLARVRGPADPQPWIVARRRGAGRVVLLADPDVLANAALEDPARAVLAVRLLEETAAGGPVEFCETVHGFGGAGSPNAALARILWTTSFGNAALGAGLCVLLLLVAEAKRFGRIRRTLEPPRRSEYEYLDALAGLLVAGRAWRQAGGLLLLGARRRIGREGRRGARTSARSVADALAWDRPADAGALRAGAEELAGGRDPAAMVRGLAALDRALPPERPHGTPALAKKERP